MHARLDAASNENDVLVGNNIDVSCGAREVNTGLECRVREASDSRSVQTSVSEVLVHKCELRTHLGMNGFTEVASIVGWIDRMQRAHFKAWCSWEREFSSSASINRGSHQGTSPTTFMEILFS